MTRELTLSELESQVCGCQLFDCHRQIWKNGSTWLGNLQSPRETDGIILITSRIRAVFRECDSGAFVTASQGDAVYVPKGTCYTVAFHEGGFDPDMYTINFALWDGAGSPLPLGNGIRILLSGASPDCRHLAAEIRLLCLDPRGSRLQRQARFLDFLAALNDSAALRSDEHAAIYKGVRLLISEWDRNEHMTRYAEACQISESSFYQHFKDWAGVSPNEYRTNMRIAAARSMLRNSSMTVREIAAEVGFPDPYYFSRCFRRSVGLSPIAFRRQYNHAEKNDTFFDEST